MGLKKEKRYSLPERLAAINQLCIGNNKFELKNIAMDLQRINELGFEKISIWYTFVLVLSFSFWWHIFIVVSCLVAFFISTSDFAFQLNIPNLSLILYFSDFCYLLDLVFTMSYIRNSRLRKLKFAKSRHWTLIMIDGISLLPLELLFTFHYVDDNKNPLVRGILSQNRSLRIYRVFLLEWFYTPTIRTPWKYVFFTFILFFCKSLILGHLFTCAWYNVKKGWGCDETKFNCYLWHEVNMLNVIVLNWTGPLRMFSEVPEQIIVSCAMLAGFFITFAYIYPYTFYFSILTGCRDSIVVEKRKRLYKFLNNMIKNADLKQKIVHYFNYIWEEGEEDEESLFKYIPLSLQKEVFTDIYWEAFRHSYLLRDTSRNFKRTLSLKMSTEYHRDGEVVLFKGQDKTKMIFLVQGILQVMAEENEESPLLSFSSGTVFGELSLFLFTTSPALVKCKGSCELQILDSRGILKAFSDYPKDRKLVFQKFTEKILMARHTQWRKKRFKEDQKLEMLSMEPTYFSIVDCVKWLKMQWRNSWEGHQRHLDVIKAKAEGTRLPSWRLPVRPEIKIEFISNYLDLVVLSNILEGKKGVVCLQTKFPFSIHPEAQFLHIWRYIIIVTSLIPALVYPVCTSWFDRFPFFVYQISYVVTLLFIVDLLLKMITAVQTKHATITAMKDVFCHNLTKFTFYCDVIAAFPYQLYILASWDLNTTEAYKVGLLLHPAIVKSYAFFRISAPLGGYMDVITLLINCLTYCLLLYWLAEVIQLRSVRDFTNLNNDWIDRFLETQENKEFLRKYLVAVFRALVTSISAPSKAMYADDNLDLVLTCSARCLFFVFSCYFMGTYYSSIVVKRFGSETFRILMERLKYYLASKNISEKIAGKIVRGIHFQWKYDKASYITSKTSILNALPYNIRRQVFLETTYKALESSLLFKEESPEFLLEVLEHSDFVAVPPGLVLVTYGHTSHILVIINRGYCQLNSHLEADITSNLGKAIIVGPSNVFPLLSSFCNVPSPISVVSITDCELIVIDLNKLISIMLKYKIFKDIVDVMKETNLSVKLLTSKPALMKICAFEPQEDETDWFTKDYGKFKKCLLMCWARFEGFVHTTFIKYWGYIYTVHLILQCIFLPSCFGVLLFQSYIIMPLLVVGKIIDLLHMIVHTLFPYYNRSGLLVNHPLKTLLHYLSSAFVLDIIRFIPIFPIYYYGFADPYEKPNVGVILVSYVQCFLGLIYVVGCIGYIGGLFNETYYTSLTKFILSTALVFNLHVNLCMYVFATWTFGGPYRIIAFEVQKKYRPLSGDLLRENNLLDYYLYVSYWIIATLTTNDFDLNVPTGLQLYLSYVHALVGTILSYCLYVAVSSASKFTNMGGATFREQFISLVKYLDYEKSEDKTIERVRSYYRYLWSKTGGENIKEIFGRLPLYILEELWYPLYRPTFVKNNVFEEADEGFFRILATNVRSVFFTRGSIIIFKNEAQSYIYFLHRGKCFVYDWFMVLDIGSIVGDLHQTGLMLNKVYALTHVEMLKISSRVFFTIINNFDNLESNFIYVLKRSENFIKSDVYRETNPLRPVDSKDAVNTFELRKKDIGFEDESHFEDPDNITADAFQNIRHKPKERYSCVIYPHSWKMRLYTIVAFVDVLLTILSIPSFLMFGGLSVQAFIFIGVLDFIWLIILVTTFRVGLLDEEKGNVITNHKFIAKHYLKTGFAFDLISLLPFELIPVAWARSREKANADVVLYLRFTRYCRALSFYKFRELEWGMMRSESSKKFLFTIILFLWSLITVTSIFVRITKDPKIVAARNNFYFKREQWDATLEALVYVINFCTSANIPTLVPKSRKELLHFNCSVILLLCLKGKLISSVLSLIYFRNLSMFNYKAQVSKMEAYLKKKEASPILVKSIVDYQTNLFRFSRSENMPSLLLQSPMAIRIPLMKDLFRHHVVNFPLFEGLDNIFLDQLIARAKREVYFPGEKIVEQGDVDHRLYFIHTGEVYVINQTKERAYVEYVVGRMYAGEYFGQAQGLWFIKPHVYTYRGRTLVEIVVLNSDDWMDLRRTFPETTLKIFHRAKTLRLL